MNQTEQKPRPLTIPELSKGVYQAAYLRGEFKLRSGQISNEYFDKYQFESNPLLLKNIAHYLKDLIPAGTEVLAGLELGGVPIATSLSLETGLPVAFVRKSAKDYGTCRIAEGVSFKGKKVCIIEDVITTGGQVLLSAEDLKKEGADIQMVLCVIQRNPEATKILMNKGLRLKALFTMEQLKQNA